VTIYGDVISLKKLIDSNHDELLAWTLCAYRASLEAMGKSAVQACPPLGSQLQLGLWNLQQQLAGAAAAHSVQQTEELVEGELRQWGERSADYYKRKTEEFKEIMMIMARTAEAVGTVTSAIPGSSASSLRVCIRWPAWTI
jgi:hypothetical protein